MQKSEQKDYQLFLEEIIRKCLTDSEFTEYSLKESTLKHLIVEDISREELTKLKSGIVDSKKNLDSLVKFLTSIGIDVQQMRKTNDYLNWIRGVLSNNQKRLDSLMGVTNPFVSIGKEVTSVKAYVFFVASAQKNSFDFYNGIISSLEQIKEYSWDLPDSDEDLKKAREQTIGEYLESQDRDPKAVQDSFKKIFQKSLKGSRGLLWRFGSWLKNLAKKIPKAFGADFQIDYDAISDEMTLEVFSIPIGKLLDANIDSLPKTSAPAEIDVGQPSKADERAPDSDSEVTSLDSPTANAPSSESGDKSKKGKASYIEQDDLETIKKIANDLFDDLPDEDKKKELTKLLKAEKLIEGKKLTSKQENDQFEKWQRIAGIK